VEWHCDRGFRRLLHQARVLDRDHSSEGIRLGRISVQRGRHQYCQAIEAHGQWNAGRSFRDNARFHTDSHPNAYTVANSYRDPETFSHGYSRSDGYANPLTDGYANPLTDGHPSAHTLANRHSQSDGNAST
jgi:hypothetical protein